MNRTGGTERDGTCTCLEQRDLERGEGAGYTTAEVTRVRRGGASRASRLALCCASAAAFCTNENKRQHGNGLARS